MAAGNLKRLTISSKVTVVFHSLWPFCKGLLTEEKMEFRANDFADKVVKQFQIFVRHRAS